METEAPHVSVVIPCFNEQDCLRELHARVAAACEDVVNSNSRELVFVDDGSTDDTWNILQELSAEDPTIVAVKLSRNHGHQLALTAGLSICTGRRVLILDADLQDPPEALGPMMKIMDDGADVVYGQRRKREGESAFKLATASLFYRFINRLSDHQIPPDTGDFRLISRRALDVLNAMPERHRFVRGMVSWIGFRQEPYLYDRQRRFAGKTKYPLRKMLALATDAITSFSTKPLRLAGFMGLLTALLGVALLLYVLGSWILGLTVSGWASILAAVAILSSIQLFILGLMGTYLGRMYEQTKGRPLFIIERIERSEDRS